MNSNEIRIKKLEKILNEYKMSSKEFSKKLDMNPGYLSRLMNGNTIITDKTMKRISIAFKIPLSVLLDDNVEDFNIIHNIEKKNNNMYEKEIKQLLIDATYLSELDNQIDFISYVTNKANEILKKN